MKQKLTKATTKKISKKSANVLPSIFKTKWTPIIVAAALVVICQVGFDVRQHYVNRDLQAGKSNTIVNLLIGAVEGLYKPAPVEAATGRVYLNEAHLVLPPADSFTKLRYYVPTTDSNTETELNITTTNLMGAAESKLWSVSTQYSNQKAQLNAIFDQVPHLQACARGVQLFFSPSDNASKDFRLGATKQLNDGRTVYLYTETACHEDLASLLTYVQQVQSY